MHSVHHSPLLSSGTADVLQHARVVHLGARCNQKRNSNNMQTVRSHRARPADSMPRIGTPGTAGQPALSTQESSAASAGTSYRSNIRAIGALAVVRSLKELDVSLDRVDVHEAIGSHQIPGVLDAACQTVQREARQASTDQEMINSCLQRLDNLVGQHLERFSTDDAVAVLESRARLQVACTFVPASSHTRSLINHLMADLPSLSAHQLVSATWSITHTSNTHTSDTQTAEFTLAALAALQHHLHALTTDEHVQLAEALDTRRCTVPEAWGYHWRFHTTSPQMLSAEQAATMLRVAVILGLPMDKGMASDWVRLMLGHLRNGVRSLPADVLMSTLQAVAAILSSAKMQPGWLDDVMVAIAHRMLSARDCSGTTPEDLLVMMAALEKLGVRPSEMWMKKFLQVVGVKLPVFQAGQLAALLWGVAMMGGRPDQGLVMQLQGELECYAGQLSTTQLVQVEWAMKVFTQA